MGETCIAKTWFGKDPLVHFPQSSVVRNGARSCNYKKDKAEQFRAEWWETKAMYFTPDVAEQWLVLRNNGLK